MSDTRSNHTTEYKTAIQANHTTEDIIARKNARIAELEIKHEQLYKDVSELNLENHNLKQKLSIAEEGLTISYMKGAAESNKQIKQLLSQLKAVKEENERLRRIAENRLKPEDIAKYPIY